jgi:hypothetical protein
MSASHHIVPGLHDERHRRAFFAGLQAFRAAGGPALCQALKKGGGPCRRWALKGHQYCQHHVSNDVQRERRQRLLMRPKTRAQRERAARREAARVQRVAWQADRWAPGSTIVLGGREAQFEVDMRGLGFAASTFSPATIDAARWAWVGMQAGRITRDQLRDRVRGHVGRDSRGPVA